MYVLITGGCGFLGQRLARSLLDDGLAVLGGRAAPPLARLILADRFAPPPSLAADARVQHVGGDLVDALRDGRLAPAGCRLVFHLAAAVSAECEADLELGLRSNLEATLALLRACAVGGVGGAEPPLFVFASSVAVFGAPPGQALPQPVEDNTLPMPQTSYGSQKFAGELLVADFSRRGLVHGRSLRLMTVAVRPGRPNAAASGFLSGIVREPLAGQRARCPVPPATEVALASPARTVQALRRAAEADAAAWGPTTAVNAPSLTVSVGAMVQALAEAAGAQAAALIDWEPDPRIERIVSGWPSRVAATRAAALGLQPDRSFGDIVAAYIADHPDAVRLPPGGGSN